MDKATDERERWRQRLSAQAKQHPCAYGADAGEEIRIMMGELSRLRIRAEAADKVIDQLDRFGRCTQDARAAYVAAKEHS